MPASTQSSRLSGPPNASTAAWRSPQPHRAPVVVWLCGCVRVWVCGCLCEPECAWVCVCSCVCVFLCVCDCVCVIVCV